MAPFDFNPLVEAISLINTTNEQNVIATNRLEHILPAEQAALTLCPYGVPPKRVHFLTSKGIPYSTAATKPNPHPVHKNAERYLLKSLKYYLNEPATIISMKREKYMRIAQSCAERQVPVQLANPIITAKDVYRYSDSTPSSFEQIRNLPTPVVFIHDALHFLTREDIDRFLMRNPAVHTIIATLFCPVELLENKKTNSIEPDLYILSYPEEGVFMYTPEGDSAGAYMQETENSTQWLRTFEHQGANSYYVHHIDRVYAQHLMVISTRKYRDEKLRSFLFPRFTSLTNFFDPRYHTLSQNFIEREILQKAILYVLGQPKAKNPDLNATMQVQLSKTGSQCGPDALLHCVTIANSIRRYEVTPYMLNDACIKLEHRSNFFRSVANSFYSWLDQDRQNMSKKLDLRPYSITVKAEESVPRALAFNGNVKYYSPNFSILAEVESALKKKLGPLLSEPYQRDHQVHLRTVLDCVNKFLKQNSERLNSQGDYNYLEGLQLEYHRDAQYVGSFRLRQGSFIISTDDIAEFLDLPQNLELDFIRLTSYRVRYDDSSTEKQLSIITFKPSENKIGNNFVDQLEEEVDVTEDKNFIRNLPSVTDLTHHHPLRIKALGVYNRLMSTPLTDKPMPTGGTCLLEALADSLQVPPLYIWHVLQSYFKRNQRKYIMDKKGMSYAYEGLIIAQELGVALFISENDYWHAVYNGGFLTHYLQLKLEDGHFTSELGITPNIRDDE